MLPLIAHNARLLVVSQLEMIFFFSFFFLTLFQTLFFSRPDFAEFLISFLSRCVFLFSFDVVTCPFAGAPFENFFSFSSIRCVSGISVFVPSNGTAVHFLALNLSHKMHEM